MLGGFALVPAQTIPKGIWSIGVGVIMLGLNAARYFNGIRMSGFTTFLGVISLVSGILELFGNVQIEGAIFLIILGAYLLVKPWFDKRRLFGKAEDS
jgi:ethanolamine transporter EutH